MHGKLVVTQDFLNSQSTIALSNLHLKISLLHITDILNQQRIQTSLLLTSMCMPHVFEFKLPEFATESCCNSEYT